MARSLGAMLTETTGSVTIKDVYVGAAAGFIGGVVVNLVDSQVLGGKLSGALGPQVAPIVRPLLGGAVAGGLLYAISHKSNPSKAKGHLAGAMAVGIGTAAKNALGSYVIPALPASAQQYIKLDGPSFAPSYGGVPVMVTNGYGGVPALVSMNGPTQRYASDSGSVVDLSVH